MRLLEPHLGLKSGSRVSKAPENKFHSFFCTLEIKQGTQGRLRGGGRWGGGASQGWSTGSLTKSCAVFRVTAPSGGVTSGILKVR